MLATLTGSSRLILVVLATLTGSSRFILVGLATLTGSSRLILVGLGNLRFLQVNSINIEVDCKPIVRYPGIQYLTIIHG